ncbi:MAG: exosortase/archaeosortase family protein [Phycisphaerae bacterium]
MSTVSSTSPPAPIEAPGASSSAARPAARRSRRRTAGSPGSPDSWMSRNWLGIPVVGWLAMLGVALLMVALYHFNLERLWKKTAPVIGEPNWSHSVCVPLIGIYYLYMRRSELLAAGLTPNLPRYGLGGVRAGLSALVGLGVACVVGGVASLLALRFEASAPFGPGVAWPLTYGGAALAVLAGVALHWNTDRRGVLAAVVIMAGGIGLNVLSSTVLQNTNPAVAGYTSALGAGVAVLAGLATFMNWGLASVLAGLVLSGYGIWPGQNDFVWDVGMVLTLFGVVLTLAGWAVMKIAWFPIAFLLCALPWPGLVYSKVALPLQFIAAEVAVVTLRLTGVKANVNGSQIFMSPGPGLPDRSLNVAEACAGMRSLMTFITVGAAVAFLSGRPLWQKIVITASAVPIAILCNVARVSGQGLLDFYVSQEWSQGFAHQFAGLVMLIPAFFMILGVAWVLDNLFVEEAEEGTPRGRRQPANRQSADRQPANSPASAAAVSSAQVKGASPS